MCYPFEFVRFASKAVGINRGEPRIVERRTSPLETGFWLVLPTCYLVEFVQVKRYGRNYGKSPENNLTPCTPPFKVTQGHRNIHMDQSAIPMTSY